MGFTDEELKEFVPGLDLVSPPEPSGARLPEQQIRRKAGRPPKSALTQPYTKTIGCHCSEEEYHNFCTKIKSGSISDAVRSILFPNKDVKS